VFIQTNYTMLYTRAGDTGETGLFGTPERLPKDATRIEALGSLDELNSLVGLCKVRSLAVKIHIKATGESIKELLEQVQQNLFTIQAEVGGADKHLDDDPIYTMEQYIAAIEDELPEIKTFLLPGGTGLSALLDFTRTVCRRAERRVVTVHRNASLTDNTLSYLNRLSTLFFALARLTNVRADKEEIPPNYNR
jgi:cob(I)alamin adenosyltransferase